MTEQSKIHIPGTSYRLKPSKSVAASGAQASTKGTHGCHGSRKDALHIERREQADLAKLGKRPELKVNAPLQDLLQSYLI